MLFRLALFGIVFYLVYFLIRTIFIRPFREGYANHANRRREGDVTIMSKPKKGDGKDDGLGEYIDYEEVKE